MSTPFANQPTTEQSPPLPPLPPVVTAEAFDRARLGRRVAIIGGVAIVVTVVLILRLWSLQVLDVQSYRAQASSNGLRSISVPAPRGRILDSRGRVLVGNRPSNAVAIDPTRFPDLLTLCGRGLSGPADLRSSNERALHIADAALAANRLPKRQRMARLAEIERQISGSETVRAWSGCTKQFPQLRALAAVAGVTVATMEDAIHKAAVRAPFDSVVLAQDVDRDVLFFLKERAALVPQEIRCRLSAQLDRLRTGSHSSSRATTKTSQNQNIRKRTEIDPGYDQHALIGIGIALARLANDTNCESTRIRRPEPARRVEKATRNNAITGTNDTRTTHESQHEHGWIGSTRLQNAVRATPTSDSGAHRHIGVRQQGDRCSQGRHPIDAPDQRSPTHIGHLCDSGKHGVPDLYTSERAHIDDDRIGTQRRRARDNLRAPWRVIRNRGKRGRTHIIEQATQLFTVLLIRLRRGQTRAQHSILRSELIAFLLRRSQIAEPAD